MEIPCKLLLEKDEGNVIRQVYLNNIEIPNVFGVELSQTIDNKSLWELTILIRVTDVDIEEV